MSHDDRALMGPKTATVVVEEDGAASLRSEYTGAQVRRLPPVTEIHVPAAPRGGAYRQEVIDLPQMEQKPYEGMDLFGMRLLALWAQIRTGVFIVLATLFYWAPRYRNKKKIVKAIVMRWYLGPPLASSIVFDAFSRTLRSIRRGAMGFQALHHIYNWREREKWEDVDLDKMHPIGGPLADWWIHMTNAQAVRNRRHLVVNRLVQAFVTFARYHPGEVLRILSIACGSAQPMMEALHKVRMLLQSQGVTVELRLLDKDEAPLEHAKRLAEHFGVDEWVTISTRKSWAKYAREICDNGAWRPWMVEMIGLMDYLSYRKGVETVQMIHDLLVPGGVFFTGHILPNSEAYVLRWLIAWPMRYRQPKDLGDIVSGGGFEAEDIVLYLEPHRIHMVVGAMKR